MSKLVNELIISTLKKGNSSLAKSFRRYSSKLFCSEEPNFLLLCLLIFLLFCTVWVGRKIIQRLPAQLQTSGKNENLVCPVRGALGTRLYDSAGNFTEEYYRIKIIRQLLKSSFPQHYMNFHHKIQVGHGGRSSFIPDLVVKNKSGRGYFLVLEVKKKDLNEMEEALLYQLNPAIRILNSRYGIYYDGSRKSSCFRHDGSRIQNFDFSNIPSWFYNEWKYN